MAVITNKKFAARYGYALGQIVDDAEFRANLDSYHAEKEAEQQAAYEAAKAVREAGKRVVTEPYTINGQTMVCGTVFHISAINGAGDRYRLQREKSRQSVFATDSLANIMAKSEWC